MEIITQVSAALQQVLTTKANEWAKKSGFIKRQVKITGSWFAQTLVFGWLMNPVATLEALTQTGASLGVSVSPQALDQRFTQEASVFLEGLVQEAIGQVVMAEPVAVPLLARFAGVYLGDSSIITLPTALAAVWPGNGGRGNASKAAVKIEVGLDMLHGRLLGPLLEAGRVTDRGSALQAAPLPAGALRVTDLGYWGLDRLEELTAALVFWLIRINPQVHFTDAQGQQWDMVRFVKAQRGDQVDLPITLGADKALPARLLGQRVPKAVADERRRKLRAAAKRAKRPPSAALLTLADWSFFVTNLTSAQLSLEEALVMARLRWQIELLFKLWKSHGRLAVSVSSKPWRVLCEFYAKLLAMIIQHWFCLTCCWAFPDRSLVKAASTVRQHAFPVLLALQQQTGLTAAISALQQALLHGCRINKSRKTMRTFQLLLQFGEAPA
jgi:Transposase DDE domain